MNLTGLVAAAKRIGRILFERWRASLALKLLSALGCVLVVSTVATYLVQSRIARDALNQQALQVLDDGLDTLTALTMDRQSQLTTSLRNVAQTLSLETFRIDDDADLVARLADLRRSLKVDVLAVLDEEGSIVASSGVPLNPLTEEAISEASSGPIHLLRTLEGRYLQTSLVAFTVDGNDALLVGGYLFDDGAAYRLRQLTGHGIVLVADGRIVGTTMTDGHRSVPPLEGAELPEGPVETEKDGRPGFLRYRQIARPRGTWAAHGAVGVVMAEATGGLDKALRNVRISTMVGLTLLIGGLGFLLVRRLSRPLQELATTARRIGAGDTDAAFRASTADEIGELGATLETMRQELRHRMQLTRAQAVELGEAGERIVAAQAQERRRLSKALHDGVQRELVFLRIQASLLRDAAESGDLDATEVEAIERQIDAALDSIRDFGQAIYPAILQDRGLNGALNSLSARSPVAVDLEVDPEPLPRLAPAVEANIYFLISEAVTNALKHAEASAISVEVDATEARLVLIEVVDDGDGFGEGEHGSQHIPHLKDRARVFGGSCTVQSRPGHGTTVLAAIPADGRRAVPADADESLWTGATR